MKNELTAKRMQLALSNANMIPQELAEKSGVSKSSISQYVNGSHAPSNISSGKIGKVLDVNPLWLMGFDVDMKESIIAESPEEIEKEKFDKYKHIVDKYHFISTHSPDGASVVDTVLDREYSIAKKLKGKKEQIQKADIGTEEKFVPKRIISYYQKLASAGKGEYLFDGIPTDLIEVADTEIAKEADFVIGVNGHSMEPTYCDGEKVFVKKMPDIATGEIGIFLKGNECYIKELGTDRLISHNADKNTYPDIPASESIILVGKVLGKVNG